MYFFNFHNFDFTAPLIISQVRSTGYWLGTSYNLSSNFAIFKTGADFRYVTLLSILLFSVAPALFDNENVQLLFRHLYTKNETVMEFIIYSMAGSSSRANSLLLLMAFKILVTDIELWIFRDASFQEF